MTIKKQIQMNHSKQKFRNHSQWYIIGILIFIIAVLIFVFCYQQKIPNLVKFFSGSASFLTVLVILITLLVEARQFKILQFENAFFNMTNFYNRIVENLKYPNTKKGFSEKREMLKGFYYEVIKEQNI